MRTEYKIKKIMSRITDLLLRKNESYGDSATKPCNIFGNGSATENICARIDDKLARIQNAGLGEATYDTIDDLIGYLCLLKIAIEDKEVEQPEELTLENLGEQIIKSTTN